MIRRILERMKYVYRVRRLVKIVFEETNTPTSAVNQADTRPPVMHVLAQFTKLNKNYAPRTGATILAIATGDKYLEYEPSIDPRDKRQRITVKSDGLKLITSHTYYINELAGSLGKISSPITVLISLIALGVSVYALRK